MASLEKVEKHITASPDKNVKDEIECYIYWLEILGQRGHDQDLPTLSARISGIPFSNPS
jgi:hypothetical protein